MAILQNRFILFFLATILSIPLLVLAYILIPPELALLKDSVVWALFIVFILLLAMAGIYLINRYKKEDKPRLQRMLENITAGMVGALLVTFLDSSGRSSLGVPSLSPDSLLQFVIGLGYVVALFVFVLGVSLLPIWILLGYIEKH